MKLSFQESYQILNITDDCDWPTFRKKYKSLVQKSHPDRFEDNTPEHKEAEANIQKYIAAYKLISDYYTINKRFPPSTSDNQINKELIIRRKRPPVVPLDRHVPQVHNKNRPVFYISILVSFIYLLYLAINKLDIDKTNEITETAHPAATIEKPVTPQAAIEQENYAPSSQEHFTIGSNLGEVISIQGKPSAVDGNTWYYGKSYVTFSNGMVTDWYRAPENPLYVDIKNITVPVPNEMAQPINKNSNKPYWQK